MEILKFIIDTSKPLKKYIWGMIWCVLVMAIDANGRPYIIKLLINQASQFELSFFIILSTGYVLLQFSHISAMSLFDWFGTLYHTKYRPSLAHNYLDRITKYSYSFFQETPAGTITSRISDAFNIIPMIVFTTIKFFLEFIVTTTISMILLAKVDIYFMFAALIWIVIFLLLSWFFYDKATPLNEDYSKSRPKIYGFLTDYISNILSVWCFNNAKREKETFFTITEEFTEKGRVFGRFLRNFYFISGVIITIYMVFILVLLGSLSVHKLITPGDFALVFMINYKIVDMLTQISSMLREYVTNLGIVKQAIEIFDYKIEVQDVKDAKELDLKFPKIRFENVEFHYKGSKPLFTNEIIAIEAGQKVGVVGNSGGGKTSFVNLILRLYDVTKGRILIDEQDISKVTLESLRKNIAIIQQDPSLFHRSLFENIRYGNEKASYEEVIEAAKKSKAHDFIVKLSEGYNSLVGEKGIKLSGGQRQRVAMARAILKNAPILILDEATSQLDSITETDIQESLKDLMRGKTVIAIAHRLSTLLHMDRILVFDKGDIIEDGTHQDLLNLNGLYKKLWDAQVGGFLLDMHNN